MTTINGRLQIDGINDLLDSAKQTQEAVQIIEERLSKIEEILRELPSPPLKPKKAEQRQETNLRVTMPSGEVIYYDNATDTFAETIVAMGLRNVCTYARAIVTLDRDTFEHNKCRERDGYYILTGGRVGSTERKRYWLSQMSERLVSRGLLEAPLKIETLDK